MVNVNTQNEDALTAWIHASREREYLLFIAGRLSGIHSWKRTHTPLFHQILGTTVIIYFDGSESLTLSDATGINVHPNGDLSVKDVREAKFSWHSENDLSKDCFEIFSKFGRIFNFSRMDDIYTTSTSLLSFSEQFVLLQLANLPKSERRKTH